METVLRLIHLDALQVAVWLTTTKDPSPAEWAGARATLAESVRAANGDVSNHRIFVVSDGGSPSSAQRKQLFDETLLGHPVPTAIVSRAMSTNPVRRAMASALALLKPHYRVFEPKDVLLAMDHIGVKRTQFDAIWSALRFLQSRLGTVVTMRVIADELHLPLDQVRPSQIPPSVRPPPPK